MGEVIPINLNRASLEEIATYINQLDQTNAINCWHIAESLAQAKDICEDEGRSWGEYVEQEVGYSRVQANRYVQVCETIGSRGSSLAEKGCNFNTLLALSARDLPKSDRKRLIDKMAKKKTISQQYGVEIQAEVRAALPAPRTAKIVALTEFTWPPFERRLEEAMADEHWSVEKAARLFALDEMAHPSDIRIIAKHWKQKYHPDRGGSAEEFDAICRAEQIFTEEQESKGGAE